MRWHIPIVFLAALAAPVIVLADCELDHMSCVNTCAGGGLAAALLSKGRSDVESAMKQCTSRCDSAQSMCLRREQARQRQEEAAAREREARNRERAERELAEAHDAERKARLEIVQQQGSMPPLPAPSLKSPDLLVDFAADIEAERPDEAERLYRLAAETSGPHGERARERLDALARPAEPGADGLLPRRRLPPGKLQALLPAEIRRQLESDSRFAVPPPLRQVVYETQGRATDGSHQSAEAIRLSPAGSGFWLRQTRSRSEIGDRVVESSSNHMSALAGLVTLAYADGSDEAGKNGHSYRSWPARIELTGTIFPLVAGQRFLLATDYESASRWGDRPEQRKRWRLSADCTVGPDVDAASVRPEFPGRATTLDCNWTTIDEGRTTRLSRRDHFLPELGLFASQVTGSEFQSEQYRRTISRLAIE